MAAFTPHTLTSLKRCWTFMKNNARQAAELQMKKNKILQKEEQESEERKVGKKPTLFFPEGASAEVTGKIAGYSPANFKKM